MIKNANTIREEANAVDIIGKYVKLNRRGTTWVGLCPFHSENSPSFTVFETNNRYKCFGCGEGGDTINFLMEHDKLTYPEALEKAAMESKLEIEYEAFERRQEMIDAAKRDKERRAILGDTLANVHAFLKKEGVQLAPTYCDLDTKAEMVDCDGRVLKKETVEHFGIVQAPDENKVGASGFWARADLLELGILAKGDYGEYDFFKNRLLFRITNNTGKIVGLGGRRLRSDDAVGKRAKYINSKSSLLYDKSTLLFGLHENRKGIREAKKALLVEGYMDVVTPHDFGVGYCVAPCGTALTESQAKELRRYTDEVVILRDGDAAGSEAAKKDVEILVREGFKVGICVLQPPIGLADAISEQAGFIEQKVAEFVALDPSDKTLKRQEKLLAAMREKLQKMTDEAVVSAYKDPDAFLRKKGKKAFEEYLDKNTQDAVIWRVMSEVTDKTDIYEKEAATNIAGSLLSLIESESLREHYSRELCKPANLGAVKRILADSVKAFSEVKSQKSDLTAKQKTDVLKYGIYENYNKYFISSNISGQGWAVSNFVVRPIIFIEGSKESIRLVEILNEKGIARILDINSKNFVELGPFKQTVEARGNYRFEGKPEHFSKLKAKVYDEMRTAFPIYTLGQHREGFFTFANGIVVEGKFYPVDEYGLVSFSETKYYLPAFSKIRDHIKADDVESDYEDEKYYVFSPGEPGATFREWTELMVQVHGENAMVGILYYLSLFVRDAIYERLDNMFPHLNFFGLPGSGKNQLAASLITLFGRYRQPVHIVNATDAAFFRRISQFRHGLAWYDEYSNNADHKRVEALKQFADGTGRSKAQYDSSNRTNTSPVVSGCIISGQQQPTADVALFTRCISLNFSKTEFSPEAQELHTRLKALEKGGKLTVFTAQIHALRPSMLEGFDDQFHQAFQRMKELTRGLNIMDRIVRSYAAMLCAYQLLKDKLEFAFDAEAIEGVLLRSISTQRESIFSENEVSIWWRIVEFFIANGELDHSVDLVVEEASVETFDIDRSGKQREVKTYQNDRLLYINFSRSHPLYLAQHQKQRGAKGLDLEALKHYLKSSPGFEGYKRAKKFGGVAKPCFVFNCEELPFDMEDTIRVLARRRNAIKPTEEAAANPEEPGTAAEQPATYESSTPLNNDLPF